MVGEGEDAAEGEEQRGGGGSRGRRGAKRKHASSWLVKTAEGYAVMFGPCSAQVPPSGAPPAPSNGAARGVMAPDGAVSWDAGHGAPPCLRGVLGEGGERAARVVVVLRGLSGSGKSTLAARLLQGGGAHVSADGFFYGRALGWSPNAHGLIKNK